MANTESIKKPKPPSRISLKNILSTKKTFADSGSMQISISTPATTGTIGFLKIYFYKNATCDTSFTADLLGEASVIDNSMGFAFNSGQVVHFNINAIYTLAFNQGISPDLVHCMQVYVDGSNFEAKGVSCNDFTDVTCNNLSQTCTSGTSNLVSWVLNPSACSPPPATIGVPSAPSVYVSNYLSNTVTQCNIQSSDKALVCAAAQSLNTVTAPLGIGANNGYTYIVNSPTVSGNPATITLCKISAADGGLGAPGACSIISTAPVILSESVSGAVLNTPFIYFTDFGNNTVVKCTVSPSEGTLSGCESTGTYFTRPIDLVISNSFAYITNQGEPPVSSLTRASTGFIRICSVDFLSGALTCLLNDVSTGLNFDNGGGGVAISNAYTSLPNDNAYLYATNSTTPNNSVYRCPITSPGILDACTTTGDNLNTPSDIIIHNGFAYITNQDSNEVRQCTVHTDGTLTPCLATGANFSGPGALDIY
ncbi:MAG: hypothetical protein WC627_00245 [Legionella sp.]|jgi:hypothetical protein